MHKHADMLHCDCNCAFCMHRYPSPTALFAGAFILQTSAAVAKRSMKGHQLLNQTPNLAPAQTDCAELLFRKQTSPIGHTPLRASAYCMLCQLLQTDAHKALHTKAYAQAWPGAVSQLPQALVSAGWCLSMQPPSMCSLLMLHVQTQGLPTPACVRTVQQPN